MTDMTYPNNRQLELMKTSEIKRTQLRKLVSEMMKEGKSISRIAKDTGERLNNIGA
jgi:uncharacterized protein YerC